MDFVTSVKDESAGAFDIFAYIDFRVKCARPKLAGGEGGRRPGEADPTTTVNEVREKQLTWSFRSCTTLAFQLR